MSNPTSPRNRFPNITIDNPNFDLLIDTHRLRERLRERLSQSERNRIKIGRAHV